MQGYPEEKKKKTRWGTRNRSRRLHTSESKQNKVLKCEKNILEKWYFVNDVCDGDSVGAGKERRVKRALLDLLGCNCSKDLKTEEEGVLVEVAR